MQHSQPRVNLKIPDEHINHYYKKSLQSSLSVNIYLSKDLLIVCTVVSCPPFLGGGVKYNNLLAETEKIYKFTNRGVNSSKEAFSW